MGMLWPTLETLLGSPIVIVLWVGGREVLLHRITVGSFVAFNTYMVQLTWPIIALGWVINIFQRGTASMGRIQNILAEQPEITDAGSARQRRSRRDSRRDRVPQSQLPLRAHAASQPSAASATFTATKTCAAEHQSASARQAPAWRSSDRPARASPRWSR